MCNRRMRSTLAHVFVLPLALSGRQDGWRSRTVSTSAHRSAHLAKPTLCLTIILIACFLAIAYIIMLPENFHMLHIFATYPAVKGNFASRMLGKALAASLSTHVAEREKACDTEAMEYVPGDAFDSRELARVDWPVTIRGAFQANRSLEKLVEWLGDTRQNLFNPCAVEPRAVLGHEVRPCLNITFREKVWAAADPARRRGFAHNVVLEDKREVLRHAHVLENEWKTARKVTSVWEHSSIHPHLTLSLATHLSLVYYYHAHMDFAVVWNMEGVKEWNLLHPDYLPSARPVWSGNSLLATKTPETKCVIKTVQRPGDVLVLPPWWLHSTRILETTNETVIRSLGYNQHFARKTSIIGQLTFLLETLFGPSAFYEAVSPIFTPSERFYEAAAKALAPSQKT